MIQKNRRPPNSFFPEKSAGTAFGSEIESPANPRLRIIRNTFHEMGTLASHYGFFGWFGG